MRVAVFPADDGGCGRYRMRWPAEALTAQGADITLRRPDADALDIQAVWRDHVDPLTARTVRSELVDVLPPDADVVVIQRPLHRHKADAVKMLQAHGVRVIVEIDDDFACLHRRNVTWPDVHPTLNRDRNHHHLLRACAAADHVVVTTPALARRYARHGRFTIVPNHVPASYLEQRAEPHDGVYVGWSGSIDTHPTDLQVTGGAVARAVQEAAALFAVIGTGKGVRRALGLAVDPVASGWVPIEQYPEALAQLDIGIVPLDDIQFNHAKSWLKGLEMAAVGVPFVASPTDDYVRLAKLGAGVLAGKPKDWRRHISALAMSADLRADLAGRGRQLAGEWTIEGNCERWWDAWTAPLRTRSAA